MAKVNTDILGISELKWTGMGEFNSDDHYIYYCGQGSLRRNVHQLQRISLSARPSADVPHSITSAQLSFKEIAHICGGISTTSQQDAPCL